MANHRAGLRGGASVLDRTSFNASIHPCKKIFQSEGEQDRERSTGSRRDGGREGGSDRRLEATAYTSSYHAHCTNYLDDRFKYDELAMTCHKAHT